MKVAITIIGIILLIGYIGSKIDTSSAGDDSASEAPKVTHSATDPNAERGARLARKGQRVSNQLVRLSNRALRKAESGDFAGACAIVDAQIRKVNQLGRIVERLRPFVDAGTVAKFDQNEIDVRASIGEARRGCLEMGY